MQQEGQRGTLNRIERRHHEAIVELGRNPEDLLFEAQLAGWRKAGFWLEDEEFAFIRSLGEWAPSRYELLELLPLYWAADRHIRRMQAMSVDRFPFKAAKFSIATEPLQLVAAVATSRRVFAGIGAPEVRPDVSEPESTIWVHAGLVNVLKVLTAHVACTLVAPEGDLPRLFEAVSRDPDPRVVFRRLCSFVPTLGMFSSANPSVQVAGSLLLQSCVTFVAGHEAGHIYLGHTGANEMLNPWVSVPAGLDSEVRDEMAADMVGLISLWDGMGQEDEGARLSIDYAWLGPVLYLAFEAGRAAADSAENLDSRLGWVNRLKVLLKGLFINLGRNGFESRIVVKVFLAVPPMAGAIYEWVRLGGVSRGDVAEDEFDPWFYDDMRSFYQSLLSP